MTIDGLAVTVIGSGAFSGCDELLRVVFNGGSVVIASDAFTGCSDVAFVCSTDSDAAAFAEAKGFTVVEK